MAMMFQERRFPLALIVGLLLSFALPVKALAEPLPEPRGEVILRLSGDLAYPNIGDELHLDRALLMSLSPTVIETHTPWTQGVGRFEGPLARAVLAAAGARGDRVHVRSLNDFEAEIPLSDFHDFDVILAVKRDGEPIAVRDLGPVFVLYPFDDYPELLNETIRFRSVWHVTSIHVP
jgi:hypothetical protein